MLKDYLTSRVLRSESGFLLAPITFSLTYRRPSEWNAYPILADIAPALMTELAVHLRTTIIPRMHCRPPISVSKGLQWDLNRQTESPAKCFLAV